MRILVLGGDGYLGWPTAIYLSARGHEVVVVDSFVKREWERALGVQPLIPVPPLLDRIEAWRASTQRHVDARVGDLTDPRFVRSVLESLAPHAIVHYGEQPSAPFSKSLA